MAVAAASDVWTDRRRRVAELRTQRGFVRQLLDFYGALLPVQEDAFRRAASDAPPAADLVAYVAETVLPHIADVTVAVGPDSLRAAVIRWLEEQSPYAGVQRWIDGKEQPMVERFLARASLGPVLEGLGSGVRSIGGGARDEQHCPDCGGAPQLSYTAAPAEDLTTGRRFLMCGRCGVSWGYPRMKCAGCGESAGANLPIFSEEGTTSGERGNVVRGLPSGERGRESKAVFQHIRVEACDSCRRYLLGIDCADDPRIVPLVDELSALPLDLVARERGYSKIIPNLLGF